MSGATTTDDRNLKRFVALANRGRHGGASGGERSAYEMAIAMLEYGTRLDDQAVDGLIEFIRFAKGRPGTAGDLIGQ